MIDVVSDPDMLEVGSVLLSSSLAEVDVQIVEGDRRVGPQKYIVNLRIKMLICTYQHVHCTLVCTNSTAVLLFALTASAIVHVKKILFAQFVLNQSLNECAYDHPVYLPAPRTKAALLVFLCMCSLGE